MKLLISRSLETVVYEYSLCSSVTVKYVTFYLSFSNSKLRNAFRRTDPQFLTQIVDKTNQDCTLHKDKCWKNCPTNWLDLLQYNRKYMTRRIFIKYRPLIYYHSGIKLTLLHNVTKKYTILVDLRSLKNSALIFYN